MPDLDFDADEEEIMAKAQVLVKGVPAADADGQQDIALGTVVAVEPEVTSSLAPIAQSATGNIIQIHGSRFGDLGVSTWDYRCLH